MSDFVFLREREKKKKKNKREEISRKLLKLA